ncbi:hypothetical protein TI04_02095 [Achromatium sp. WMS2]|nr:hypothetical protein TI04_02095 [Achromatium sp. WMS2]
MSWLRLSITAGSNQIPQVEEAFAELGAVGISYTDAADQPLLELKPGETTLWQLSIVTALFAYTPDVIEQLTSAVYANLPQELTQTLKYEVLEDKVWERAWLQHFAPMRFGQRLWIYPTGYKPPTNDISANSVLINLDPGLAFGTGSHPTTALCLMWLEQANLIGKTVLDYGCGSGILAIAAAGLGASTVTAVDYDPQALEATYANLAKNNFLASQVKVTAPDIGDDTIHDCVIANILANSLIELQPVLTAKTCCGGYLVLSGIIDSQADTVMAAYQKDFTWEAPKCQDEWVLLAGVRRKHIC